MLELDDIEQMIRLFGIDFSRQDSGEGALFVMKDFGVIVVFNDPHHNYDNDNWWYATIEINDNLEEKRMEVFWQLMKGGYLHYMRVELPNTYKKMMSMFNYDRRIIEKRLDIYGSKQKYNYFRIMNKAAINKAANFVMSTDPGFYDFLQG